MPPSDNADRDALRRSESRYRRLFETARDGILLLNAESAQIEDVNPFLVELLGYSHEEFLGKKLWEVGAFADIAQSKEMFAVLQVVGYVRYENLPLKTRRGATIAVEFVSNAYDCEGKRVIQCNIRDISAQHEAARVLQEFKAIIDASDDAIISQSLDGVIRSWNPGAEALYGYTAAQAVGQPISIIVPPDQLASEQEVLQHVALGQRVQHVETQRQHQDGHLLDISATVSPIRDNHDIIVGLSRISRDITDRKIAESTRSSLEAQLRESQKMEAIGTLAGGIAHDFNNIIATILGNVDLAIEDTADNPSAQGSLLEIRKAGRRARDLVQQILSFSRRQTLERHRIALPPVLEETVRLMRATFPARVQITLDITPDVPLVLADATQIEQVLLNLCTNAMQAAHGDPQTIDIRMDSVMLDGALASNSPALRRLHSDGPATMVRLTVRNGGRGMDEITLARIFEPFFTTKPMGEGTGLGLSVVRGIVQAHDGAIVVSSLPAAGTTFTIYLPAARAQTDTGASALSDTGSHCTALHGQSRRLLYVDDDESIVFLVRRLLERRGFKVSGFTDAREALQALAADPTAFDLMLSDYNMPNLSGLDVARAVRDIRADLPVGIVSGFIDERLLSQAKSVGVRELIVKAGDVKEFCEAIQRLMDSLPPAAQPLAATATAISV